MIRNNNKKLIAGFFMSLMTVQNFFPVAAFALTSGPAQPEMQKFQPAGASDMVDLFSGDLKYNIPLLDVGGYPVNLSYQSGGSMEDEASWVGMGWSLNPGVMNRTMRGIPDDFTGDQPSPATDPADLIKTIQHKKEFKKIGGQLVLKPSIFGWEFGSASLHLGVYKDNYYGIGGNVGASVSFSADNSSCTTLTAGLGLDSDPRSGVTVSPSFSLSSNNDDAKETNTGTLSGGLSYNTRSGLQQVNLGQSFGFGSASLTKDFIHTYTPTFYTNTTTQNSTFNFDLGAQLFGGYLGIGGAGYVYSEKNAEPQSSVPAYGYLNYSKGKNNVNALLDFNREKDGVFIQNAPAIPVPVATEDYFEATSQAGSQQFRPFYNGDYTIFDRTFTKKDGAVDAGITIGAGNVFQGGARLDLSKGQAITHKWTAGNQFLSIAEPPPYTGVGKEVAENVYFKKTGEQTGMDDSYYNTINSDVTEKVAIPTGGSSASTFPGFKSATTSRTGTAIQRQKRDIRTSTFQYLTAAQASVYGLDKRINGVSRVDAVNTTNPTATVHKAHHISEISVTDNDGKRMVYGIPVYNTDQEEVSFSVGNPTDFDGSRKTGLVDYNPGTDNSEGNTQGRENTYNRKVIPPYATSYLLTGILSSDYVDKTGDGISDDDLGTAVKLGYTKLNGNYNWRAPYEQNKANYNEGFLSDKTDDKGNYVFGQKEVWYLQSIGSKTMIAQFFTSDRQDALGVAGENGGVNTSRKLQKLDSIRLFSKADLLKNGTLAVPIKVAHFEYDYSLYPGVPNNSGAGVLVPDPANPGSTIDVNVTKGKLTLKKVYFTFGSSSRGQSNPYLFSYDMRLIRDGSIANLPSDAAQDVNEKADRYTQRQVDRWGTYKQSFYNPPFNNKNAFNNSEYPYSLQVTDHGSYDERQLADRLASKWQLNSITTPMGGIISVEYESDDYAYVQDRKAMVMCPLAGVGASGQATGMIKAGKLYVTVPVAASDATDFINTYLGGPDGRNWSNVFYKIFTDVDAKGHNEFVYGYAEIDYSGTFDISGNTVGIPVKSVNNYNPVSKAAWQMIQTDLPQYAYENYDNSDASSGDVVAAVRSIVQAFVNLRELFEPYDKIASNSHFADKVDISKSLVRLNYPVGKTNGRSGVARHTYGKLGGGGRVRKVEISDEWNNMTGVSGTKTAVYGLKYDYTTADDKNNLVSSGVAAYEPQIGNEENPFHEPLDYTEKVQWSADRYHYIEKPFGESYFPAPSVGYSEVKVTSYGSDYTESSPVMHTGYTITAFYTARDFPTRVDYLPLEMENYENDLTLMLFASKFTKRVTTSQGFKITVNDMHGKQKSAKIFDKAGALLSSTEYFYNVDDDKAQQQQLNNTVLALNTDGSIPAAGKLLGTDAELVTDVRESSSSNNGTSIGAYVGVFDLIWPIPFVGINFNQTASVRSYNSVSHIKVIHQYGIVKQVRTTRNGSTLTAVNLLWDAQTGDVLLTQNQNEFDDYTYAFHYPAYMAYDGMGSAYQNIGATFAGFMTGADGQLAGTGASYLQYLSPGDELVAIDPGSTSKGWVLQSSDGTLRFIDQYGNFITGSGNYMIVRSGRRNLLDASAGTVISMINPLVSSGSSYLLQMGVDKKVLDAKALTYKDEWGVPVSNNYVNDLPQTATYYPVTKSPGNYYVENTPSLYTSCGDVFFGAYSELFTGGNGITVVWPGRSYLDFGAINLPANAVIQSVKISLFSDTDFETPSTTGDNAAYLKRVIQMVDCSSTLDWNTQPAVTETNRAFLPKSTSTFQDYPDIDITGMFTDWLSVKDIPNFRIQLSLINELTVTDKSMTFNGKDGPNPPQLVISYISSGHCQDPLNQVLNPYFQGVKGNWRANLNYVYQVNRSQVPGDASQAGGTNIRSSGYYASYTPYWTLANHSLAQIPQLQIPGAEPDQSPSDPRWVWTGHPVYFDQKGNEVESTDALKRYSSALFGYQQSLATAVAANARHNEIASDGFEDYYFGLPVTTADPCPAQRHLDMGITLSGSQYCSGGNCIVSGIAHSGNYSLKLSSAISISKPAGSASSGAKIIGFDAAGRCMLQSNEQAQGFSPVNGKKYLLSLWVKDGNANSNLINGLQVNINGSSIDLSNVTVPVVEGWKKLDIPFTGGANFGLQLTGQANIYIDDLRLLPFDGQLKSFVYDDQSLRLLGQLDENNFGIFYEYDEEGTPIRVKKETERGVMTVKENRQSFRQH